MATICSACGNSFSLFSNYTQVTDGTICDSCFKKSGLKSTQNPFLLNVSEIKQHILIRNTFSPTKAIGMSFEIDETNHLFAVRDDLFKYEELSNYELVENGESITKGGLGSAIAGGLLFGGVGAIVGGVTGKKRTKNISTSLRIIMYFNYSHVDMLYLDFVSSPTKVDSVSYRNAQKNAHECVAVFEKICEYNRTRQKQSTSYISNADEIMKYKKLFDDGIITQDEFEAKKKQLLNL